MTVPSHRLVVAPMMRRTFPEFRTLLRRITRRTLLVTEMISVRALVHGDREAILPPAADGPVAAQLGGGDPASLAEAARFAEARGYDEVDLNCGCPSDRAADADVGACLMLDRDRVARAVRAMADAVDVPVTVKCRIGVETPDGRAQTIDDLARFAVAVRDAGAARLAVHARVAVLEGLDPHANRTVPPLRHDEVHDLAAQLPGLVWQCNGGITTIDQALAHLAQIDGVLIGRAAWDDPMELAAADRRVFDEAGPTDPDVADVLADVLPRWQAGADDSFLPLRAVESLAGLRHARPGAKAWRHGLAQLRQRGDVAPDDVLALWAQLPDLASAAA